MSTEEQRRYWLAEEQKYLNRLAGVNALVEAALKGDADAPPCVDEDVFDRLQALRTVAEQAEAARDYFLLLASCVPVPNAPSLPKDMLYRRRPVVPMPPAPR